MKHFLREPRLSRVPQGGEDAKANDQADAQTRHSNGRQLVRPHLVNVARVHETNGEKSSKGLFVHALPLFFGAVLTF
jgi:hypothetical protein